MPLQCFFCHASAESKLLPISTYYEIVGGLCIFCWCKKESKLLLQKKETSVESKPHATYKYMHRHLRFLHTDPCNICSPYIVQIIKACTPNDKGS